MNEALIPKRPEYYIQTGSMFENPYGVPKDEIISYILENPAEVVAQVVFGKYVESSGLVFFGEQIQQMFDRSLTRVTGDRYTDQEARAESREIMAANARNPGRYNVNALYATGVDLARQTDYTVITTLDIRTRPAKVVYYRRLNRVPWESIYREVGRAAAMWGGNILADKTGMGGDVVMDALESRFYCPEHDRTFLSDNPRCPGAVDCNGNHWLPLSCVEGYEFSGQRKKQLIESLRNSMSIGYVANSDLPFGWLRSPPIVQLEEELAFYIWEDKNLETDCVMSLALAAWQGLGEQVGNIVQGSSFGG